MNAEDPSLMKIREIVFDPDDFFDQEKMIVKLDHLIDAASCRAAPQDPIVAGLSDFSSCKSCFKINISTIFPTLMKPG